VFKRLVSRTARAPAVALTAGPDGLRVRLATEEVAVEYLHPGAFDADEVALPLDALASCEGKSRAVVLTQTGDGHVEVTPAGDGGSPPGHFHVRNPEVPQVPAWPDTDAANGPELLVALERAVQIASKENGRLALSRLQLRGRKGDVVASDGRQLLIQGGFSFPWQEDILVASAPVFAAPELGKGGLRVARSAGHVLFRTGPWTVACKVAPGERYPAVDAVVPPRRSATTAWRLGPGERATLVRSLPKLPGGRDAVAPVAVDLGTPVVLRAAGEGPERPVEMPLSGSRVEGRPLRFRTDRHFLRTACRLGFEEVELTGPERPAVCRDARRVYAWMLLGPAAAPHPYPARVPPAGLPARPASQPAGGFAAPGRRVIGLRGRSSPSGRGRPAGWFPRLAQWLAGVRQLAGLIEEQRRRERSA
jgi:hypothetical protein